MIGGASRDHVPFYSQTFKFEKVSSSYHCLYVYFVFAHFYCSAGNTPPPTEAGSQQVWNGASRLPCLSAAAIGTKTGRSKWWCSMVLLHSRLEAVLHRPQSDSASKTRMCFSSSCLM